MVSIYLPDLIVEGTIDSIKLRAVNARELHRVRFGTSVHGYALLLGGFDVNMRLISV